VRALGYAIQQHKPARREACRGAAGIERSDQDVPEPYKPSYGTCMHGTRVRVAVWCRFQTINSINFDYLLWCHDRVQSSVELCRAHRFIVKNFGIATIGVAASQLPDLEERIPVDVLDNVFDRDILEDLCPQHLRCRWRVCLVCPVDLQRELKVITANPRLNAWCAMYVILESAETVLMKGTENKHTTACLPCGGTNSFICKKKQRGLTHACALFNFDPTTGRASRKNVMPASSVQVYPTRSIRRSALLRNLMACQVCG
jgi:hypothetical protein